MGVVLSAGAGGGGEDCHVCCVWQGVSRTQPPPEPATAHAHSHRGAALCLSPLPLHRQTKAPHEGSHISLAPRDYRRPHPQRALKPPRRPPLCPKPQGRRRWKRGRGRKKEEFGSLLKYLYCKMSGEIVFGAADFMDIVIFDLI